MKSITRQAISTYCALIGILFLIIAARDIYSNGVYLVWGITVSLIVGIGITLKAKMHWVAFYQYILVLFYNPLIIAYIAGKQSSTIDVIIGISFFLIGLFYFSFTGIDSIANDSLSPSLKK
jgi:hypothetical protein